MNLARASTGGLKLTSIDGSGSIYAYNSVASSYTQFVALNDQNTISHSLTFGFSGTTAGAPVTNAPATSQQGFQGTIGSHPFTLYTNNTARMFVAAAAAEVSIANGGVFGFSGNAANVGAGADTALWQEASHNLSLIDNVTGTNALGFRVYNTTNYGSKYERGVFDWTTSSNILTIGSQKSGSGTNRDVNFVSASGKWTFVSPGSSVTPTNNGDLCIQATSNTSLTFKYKGSDGTVRSGSITLS